jgi:hypothetical protein
VDDPNDVRGPLDVRRVWLDPTATPPEWTIVTFVPWEAGQTKDRGFAFVFLDTKKGAGSDYYALLRSDGRAISGSLWRDVGTVGDVRLGALRVRQASDGLSVVVQVPLGRLQFGALRTFYRWSVVTTFTGRVCRATCIDHVPDQGAIEQPLATPSPSPTTTPTTSPTSTPTTSPTSTPTTGPVAGA